LESKLQDYEEQETGWAVSALEVRHSAIAVTLHLRSLSGGGSANSVGPHNVLLEYGFWNPSNRRALSLRASSRHRLKLARYPPSLLHDWLYPALLSQFN
jgi:hypothetical protein